VFHSGGSKPNCTAPLFNQRDSALAAALVTTISIALAMVAAPVVVAPPAHADACAAVHGRRISVGGCTDGAGYSILLAPAYAGQTPCYTPDGQPYYTPDGDPC
jgi:hypothetical protein